MVGVGRYAIVVILAVGIWAAAGMDDVYSVLQLMLTINVPFGAAIMLIYFWRRLTAPSVWAAVLLSALLNIVFPSLLAPALDGLARSPALTRQVEHNGRRAPVFFESVVRDQSTGGLVGTKRFHLELWVLDAVGLDPSAWSGGGGEAGVLALAYLAAQATKPLRIGVYFLILPVVARFFGPKAPPA
jgi:hypothetical protein